MTIQMSCGRGRSARARDDAIKEDLFFAGVLTTNQVASRYWPEVRSCYFPSASGFGKRKGENRKLLFDKPSEQAALRRLQIMCKNGDVIKQDYTPGGQNPNIRVWMLSGQRFRDLRWQLGRTEDPRPQWPNSNRVLHAIDTSEFYVQLASELDAVRGGRYPRWEWRGEKAAYQEYKMGALSSARPHTHRPDAEVEFAGRLFIIERQSKRARKPYQEIERKTENHDEHIRYHGLAESAAILWVCDTARDVDYGRRAGEKVRSRVVSCTLDEAVDYIVEAALAAQD